jgi:signal transduction histidine kinase
LFEDDEGALWAGTLAGGVLCLRPKRLHLWTPADGLRDADTYSICEDTEGRLWLAGRNRMLMRGDDAANRSFSLIPGWDSEWPTMTVSHAPAGGMWLGTLGGLVRWQNGELRRETFRQPLTTLLTDRAGDLWMATIHGALFIRRGEEYVPVEVPEGKPRLIALAEDAAGRIWAGGLDGEVFVRSEGKFEPVALPGVRARDPIRFIIPDGPETVWISVYKRGLYRWREGRVSRLPEGAGLPSGDVRTIAPGDFDDLWIGTAEGLFQVSRANLDAVLDGRESTLPVRAYGRADGMPSAEFALGFRGATTRTRNGHLWFATARGVLDIDLRSLVDKPVARRVWIEEVWSGDALIARGGPATGPLQLPPRAARLKINYSLPQAGNAERLRFRYRLLGIGDDGWVENGGLRAAAFAHLPAGAYRFEVMAGLEDGTSPPASEGLDFTVRAAWWETTAARAGMILLGIGAVTCVVRGLVLWRVKARIRRLRESRELERERARIARDMHDELGANLTHIEMISEFADEEAPEVARERLREVALIARQTVDSLDEIVWAVNPRYDTLSALVEYLGMFAASFLAAAKIRCKIELPAELPPRPLSAGVRYHLFLAVKESLNNAAKHAGAALVRLQVAWDGERLRVVVADDGRGFDVDVDSKAGANGLFNLRERMAELHGECRIESGSGRGTRVVLELPLLPERSGLGASSA